MMKESHEGCAWLEDIDEDTFGRFCHYVYTEDYPEAESNTIVDDKALDQKACMGAGSDMCSPIAHETETPEYAAEGGSFCDGYTTRKKGKRIVCRGFNGECSDQRSMISWEKFKGIQYACPVAHPTACKANADRSENFTPVFISHARLYVLGDKYDIPQLRNMTLHKLHKSLCRFTLYKERIGDVLDLMRYVYAHTLNSKEEPMRALVSQYVVAKIENFNGTHEFEEFLQEPGSHTGDLLLHVIKRLDL